MYSMLFNLGQAMRPGAWAVDQIPLLKYIPFYARTLREQHRQELGLFRKQLQGVRNDLVRLYSLATGESLMLDKAAGGAPSSFGRYLLESQKDLGLSDDELAYLAGYVALTLLSLHFITLCVKVNAWRWL